MFDETAAQLASDRRPQSSATGQATSARQENGQ